MTTKLEIENALQAWVSGVVGLQALWSRQKVPPRKPGVTLKLDGPAGAQVVPERRQKVLGAGGLAAEFPVLLAPDGGEIEYQYRTAQTWTLQIQAFTNPTGGDADSAGLLRLVQLDALKDSTTERLRAVSVSVVGIGDVQDLSDVIETDWRDRSSLTLVLRTADVSTEEGTFIEAVEGTGEDDLAGTNI